MYSGEDINILPLYRIIVPIRDSAGIAELTHEAESGSAAIGRVRDFGRLFTLQSDSDRLTGRPAPSHRSEIDVLELAGLGFDRFLGCESFDA